MTNLTISQSTLSTENVSTAIVDKLYRLALISKVEDANNALTVSLQGNITAPAAYEDAVTYLRAKFPNLTINITNNNYYIRFADPEVERVLIQNISSDGIGVSSTDIQRTSTLPDSIFLNNAEISTFDELGRLGSISIGSYCFSNATNLTSIDLSLVTSVNRESFSNTPSLAIKLNMPNLTRLGLFSFRNSGITEIQNLGYVTTIPGYNQSCFSGCINLTKVVLPITCTELGLGAFSRCTALEEIGPVSQLTTLRAECLACTKLSSAILNFANVTVCERCAIGAASNSIKYRRRLIYFPKVLSGFSAGFYSGWYNHWGCFQNINVDLIYFRDLLNLYTADFCYSSCIALVINNITPPTLNDTVDNVFKEASIQNIYVPDTAVNTYKSDEKWSLFGDSIKPISELTKVATEADLLDEQIALIEEYM